MRKNCGRRFRISFFAWTAKADGKRNLFIGPGKFTGNGAFPKKTASAQRAVLCGLKTENVENRHVKRALVLITAVVLRIIKTETRRFLLLFGPERYVVSRWQKARAFARFACLCRRRFGTGRGMDIPKYYEMQKLLLNDYIEEQWECGAGMPRAKRIDMNHG